jgi:RimJ/RimL family protein N-acetyltransferase
MTMWMDGVWRDVRLAIRRITRRPAVSDTAPFIHAWPIEEHRAAIADSNVAHWIIEDAARAVPVGFVILRGLGTEIIEFRRIAISEKGRGYGSHAVRLVKEAAFGEMGARRIWLDVYDFNDRARAI